MKIKFRFLAALAALGLSASLSAANSISFANITGATLAGLTPKANFQGIISTSHYTGNYSAEVYSDASGNLTYAYQFTDNTGSTDSIDHVTATGFAGVSVAAAFVGDTTQLPGITGTPSVAPTSADVVGSTSDSYEFNFNDGPALGITPGSTSDILLLQTNSKVFNQGVYLTVQDGSSENLVAFAPAPLPASLWGGAGLLGMMGIFAMRRRMQMA